jgi:hypothetical protein
MQSIRAAGLHLIGSIGPLRRLAMREGLAPSWRTRPTVKETPEHDLPRHDAERMRQKDDRVR